MLGTHAFFIYFFKQTIGKEAQKIPHSEEWGIEGIN